MSAIQDELARQRRLDLILADFEQRTRTESTHPGRNFSAILEDSPELRAQFLLAVEKGRLLKLEAKSDPRFLGSYDYENGSLSLSIEQLSNADPNSANEDAKEEVNFVRFTAGHEIDHAVSREEMVKLVQRFRDQAAAIANGPSPHDYTSAVKEYNHGCRKREASAEIAGFNAVAAQVRHENPSATLEDVYIADGGASNYIEEDENSPPNYSVRPGLHIKADLQLDVDKSLEAMAKLFYDNNPGYPARNIDWAFAEIYRQEAIAQAANPSRPFPEIRINVEDFGAKVTLPLDFIDTNRPQSDKSKPTLEAPGAVPRPDDSSHPDHQLLEKIRDSVRDLEKGMGKPWDEQSERLSASALSMAAASNFSPGDDVKVALNRPADQNAAGERLFVYREGRDASPDPAANYAHMPVSQALALPASERYEQVQAMRETQALEQRAQEAVQQAPNMNGPTADGPRMQR